MDLRESMQTGIATRQARKGQVGMADSGYPRTQQGGLYDIL